MTRKNYSSPQLTVHGSVEQLTQLSGNSSVRDVLIMGSDVLAENDGSTSFRVIVEPFQGN